MLKCNPAYTAVTRNERLVVLVSQPSAPAIPVRGARAPRRWSKLRDWLGGGEGASPVPAT